MNWSAEYTKKKAHGVKSYVNVEEVFETKDFVKLFTLKYRTK